MAELARKVLRQKQLTEKIGASRTKVYRMLQEGRLPQPIKIGTSVGWFEHEIDAWLDQLAAQRPTQHKGS
jgi:prophage regulatory protein